MDQTWIEKLHAGDPEVLAQIYRDEFAAVAGAVGRVLSGADQENVVHEVFYRLLSVPSVRHGFSGGSLRAYLCRVASNLAIDYVRRYGREVRMPSADAQALLDRPAPGPQVLQAEQQLLVERFVATLPEAWRAVFELRFLFGLSQAEAAGRLGLRRTTLAYQEHCIRSRLRVYLLDEVSP